MMKMMNVLTKSGFWTSLSNLIDIVISQYLDDGAGFRTATNRDVNSPQLNEVGRGIPGRETREHCVGCQHAQISDV